LVLFFTTIYIRSGAETPRRVKPFRITCCTAVTR
jgi:hypothetical protein